MSRLRVHKPGHVMSVGRNALKDDDPQGDDDLGHVYFLLANKKLKYKKDRQSRIFYIGETRRGIHRMGESVSKHASILKKHGIKTVDVYAIECKKYGEVNTWEKLERALLLEFRSLYGQVPKKNKQGENYTEGDEFKYFRKERIRNILLNFEEA